MVKVFFLIKDGLETESLWAEIQDSSGPIATLTVMNSPFYAKGVSFLDVVSAVRRDESDAYNFVSVIAHGGHSTYRIFTKIDEGLFSEWWKKLDEEGCTYESTSVSNGVLYSIDVPNTSDIHRVYTILNDGEEHGIWGFEEAHVGHSLK